MTKLKGIVRQLGLITYLDTPQGKYFIDGDESKNLTLDRIYKAEVYDQLNALKGYAGKVQPKTLKLACPQKVKHQCPRCEATIFCEIGLQAICVKDGAIFEPRLPVNKERIFEACNELTKQGIKITQVTVREHLKATGSYSTITKYIKQWRGSDPLPKGG